MTHPKKLDSWVGWVGDCNQCGRRWYVRTNVLYTNGKRSGWGTGGEVTAANMCMSRPCATEPKGRIEPLALLEEQAPYRAALALGGEDAVWTMLGNEHR